MGNTLTWTPAERWQALQNLESALGAPDNNMTFTYNGNVYRSIGINNNGTMQVINQTTGQISTLDPVDVYGAFQAASGNPTPSLQITSPTATAAGPSMYSNAMNQIGMYSGLVNLATQIHRVSLFLQNMTRLGANLGKILGGITVFLSANSVFQGVQAMFKSGKITGSGLLNVGMSSFGVATGFNALLGSTGWATMTNPAGWVVAGAVISSAVMYGTINNMIANGPTAKSVAEGAGSFLATDLLVNILLSGLSLSGIGLGVAAAIALAEVLWSYFHQPKPEQVAAQNLTQALSPIIWTPGPLAVVTVGTIALLMGWAKNQPAPTMANLTVPAYYLNQVLSASGVSAVNLKSQTPTVVVEPGTGNVMIVSPNGTDAKGNPLVSLQSYQMAKNLQFVSSPNVPLDGAYIPFFDMVNGKLSTRPSADVLKALNIQEQMLRAVMSGALTSHDALNALFVAAAANKYAGLAN